MFEPRIRIRMKLIILDPNPDSMLEKVQDRVDPDPIHYSIEYGAHVLLTERGI